MAHYYGSYEPLEAVAAVHVELTEDESEWTDGEGFCQKRNYKRRKTGSSRTGEESGPEGFFSDDTGFYSAPEPEDVETGEEDDEGIVDTNEGHGERGDEEKQIEVLVGQQYKSLIEKYTNPKFSTIQDPFAGVNWMEMCVVLKMSAGRSGLVVAAQILDIMIQLFSRQVNDCRHSIVKIVEDLNRLNRRKQSRKGDSNKEQDPNNATVYGDDDEGYQSQPLSQQSHMDVEMDEEYPQSRRKSSQFLLPAFKRSRKFIASNEDQLLNDFVKERSAHTVSRRVNLHEHWHQAVKNPYFLDHEIDLTEFYDKTPDEMAADTERLATSAKDLFKVLKRHTNSRIMQKLRFMEEEKEAGDNEDKSMDMEVDLPMDVDGGGGDITGNNENMQPPLPPILQENAGEPENATATSPDNLLVLQTGLEEGEENVDPKAKEKKKKKKRRVPLSEKNIAELEFLVGMLPLLPGDEPEAKRPRLDEDQEGLVLQQQAMGDPENERLLNSENGVLNAIGIDQAQICGNINGDSIGNDDYHMMDDHGGDEILEDLTPVDYDGSFRPPSPLSKQATPQINFQMRTTRVNMSAIKSKFNDIIAESQNQSQEDNSPSEITFVEILQKSELDILVGPNETIPSTSFCRNTPPPSPSTPVTSKTSAAEVSVGVAFLAMLHNAAHNNFFLVEDHQGAFKVSKQRPADPLPS